MERATIDAHATPRRARRPTSAPCTRATPFVIPNPWDAGSARVFEALGFKALATTSSGFAFTLGRLDGGVTLDELAEHVRTLAETTSLPVSVDLENGYGPDPERRRATRSPAPPRPARSAARSRTSTPRATSTSSSTRRSASPPRARPPPPRLPVHAHRPSREPHPRQPRPRRHDRPPAGLRARRRRRPLRARAAQRRRDPRGRRGDLEAAERARPRACRCARSPTRAARASASAARSTWVAIARDGERRGGDPRHRRLLVARREAAARGVVRRRLGQPRRDRLLLGLRGRPELRERGREQESAL